MMTSHQACVLAGTPKSRSGEHTNRKAYIMAGTNTGWKRMDMNRAVILAGELFSCTAQK